jgi:phosphoglycerate dehydrogenase-like enzyme
MVDCSPMRPRLLVSAGPVLFASFFPPTHEARLSRLFSWERTAARATNMAFSRQLAMADALVTTWDSPYLGDDLVPHAPKLRIIAHCGGEVKSRFATQLFDKLTITNSAGPMARATAELGAAFLLYCARDVDRYRDALRKSSNRVYSDVHLKGTGEYLANREIGMIGFGRVGRALVDLLRGFDLRWIVYDPFASQALSEQYPIVFSELKPLLRRAQLLVLTAGLTERTRGILDRKTLSLLPDGAVIINIARGGLVDLAALTKEVQRKRLRCALDVTDPAEPLPVKHPLRKLPGAIVTPHIGGSGRHVRQEIAATVMDDLENFFSGKPVKNRVTKAMLPQMT